MRKAELEDSNNDSEPLDESEMQADIRRLQRSARFIHADRPDEVQVLLFHVFTHNTDEWTEDLAEALKIYQQFAQEEDCARLYAEVQAYVQAGESRGEWIEDIAETCLAGVGPFPA